MLAGLPDGLRVHAPGPLDGSANLGRVKACSFGVYPTLAENYSVALLEAALCGVPMVTFDVGGSGEIVRDGTNGFLAPAHDVDALISQAQRLLDPAAARRMAESTLDDAGARLDGAAAADAWIAGLTQFDGG
jgi:glycosyltransferase involved in cell wall biosynthesis